MQDKELRFRIPAILHKKYKIFCAEHDLSVPKQTAQLIRACLEIDQTNKKLTEHLKK